MISWCTIETEPFQSGPVIWELGMFIRFDCIYCLIWVGPYCETGQSTLRLWLRSLVLGQLNIPFGPEWEKQVTGNQNVDPQ